jgi:hypothetical protein
MWRRFRLRTLLLLVIATSCTLGLGLHRLGEIERDVRVLKGLEESADARIIVFTQPVWSFGPAPGVLISHVKPSWLHVVSKNWATIRLSGPRSRDLAPYLDKSRPLRSIQVTELHLSHFDQPEVALSRLDLSQLKSVDFYECELTASTVRELLTLGPTKRLFMCRCKLRGDVSASMLRFSSHLEELKISDRLGEDYNRSWLTSNRRDIIRFESPVDPGLEFLDHARSIQTLELSFTELNHQGIRQLAALPELVTLKLALADLPAIDIQNGDFPKLESLTMSNCRRDTSSLPEIAKMPALKTFTIYGETLDSADIVALAACKSLTEIVIDQGRAPPESIATFGSCGFLMKKRPDGKPTGTFRRSDPR